ncbi:MAG: hypothetical protein MUC68_13025 [Burkholderiaceae bacterium]|jgi:hypothetical protein|nr:hypothetical protein [Burkholderiaceae bacterium]
MEVTIVRNEEILSIETVAKDNCEAIVELSNLDLALVGGGMGSIAFL